MYGDFPKKLIDISLHSVIKNWTLLRIARGNFCISVETKRCFVSGCTDAGCQLFQMVCLYLYLRSMQQQTPLRFVIKN